MPNKPERGIGEEHIEVFINPDKPVIQSIELAPGVRRVVKRGEVNSPPTPGREVKPAVDRATAQARLDSLRGPGAKMIGGGSAPSKNGKFSR